MGKMVFHAFFGVALGGAVAFLSGCFGGSDGVENPKLEFDFGAETGSPAPGSVALFGQSMNPVEDGRPLAAKDYAAGGKVAFTPDEMDAALKAVLVRRGGDASGLGDTTVHFNVVAVSGDLETFVPGFSYRRSGKAVGFAINEGSADGGYGDVIRSYKLPKAIRGFSGRMGIYGMMNGFDYVFVPGSPYHATVEADSTFTLPRMSPGSYNLMAADTAAHKLYRSDDTLNTSDPGYSAKSWGGILFIPDGN